jgi:hypothetical protein
MPDSSAGYSLQIPFAPWQMTFTQVEREFSLRALDFLTGFN